MIEDFQKGFDSYTNSSIDDKPIVDVISKFEENYKTWHTKLSLMKSAIRLIACMGAMIYSMSNVTIALWILVFGFVIAECIGIIEEL